jgi:hypothetical protein
MTSTQATPLASRLLGLVLGAAVGFLAWAAFTGHLPSGANRPMALEHALEEPDFLRRIAQVATVFEDASPDELDDMRRIIEAHPAAPQDAERVLFLEWWAGFDPEAAYVWARADDRRHGQALVQLVLQVWARTDPLAALELVHRPSSLRAAGTAVQATGIGWRNESELAVMAGWVESLVPGLEEWIFDENDAVEQQALIQTLARNRVATRGAESTWEWARSIPDPFHRMTLLAVTSAIAARDPQEAARLVRPLVEAGDESGLAVRLSIRWCKRDPQAALAWITETPATKIRDEAVLECARSWIAGDRAGLFAYLESRPDPFPEELAPTFRLYAKSLESGDEFVRGLALVGRLGDTPLASRTTAVILRRWLERDRVAASAWIEAHPVPKEILLRAGYLGVQDAVQNEGASDPRP